MFKGLPEMNLSIKTLNSHFMSNETRKKHYCIAKEYQKYYNKKSNSLSKQNFAIHSLQYDMLYYYNQKEEIFQWQYAINIG